MPDATPGAYCHNCCHWLFPPAIGSGIYKEHGDCLAKGRGAVSDPTYSCEQWGAKPVCGYCRDCKWWTSCRPHGAGDCLKIEMSLDYKKEAHLEAIEGAELTLVTRPTFGCVQWEAKDG